MPMFTLPAHLLRPAFRWPQGSLLALTFLLSFAALAQPTLEQVAKLVASDRAYGDGFGVSVALSGNTAFIGVPNDNIGGNADQGSAYVFTLNNGTWQQTANLTASDGAYGDNFGSSVAVSGNTALIGAPYKDIGGNFDQGSAYVYDLLPKSPLTLRLDCGSSQAVVVNDKLFSADRYITGTSTPRTFTTGDIANTTEDVIYKSIRSGDSFAYYIPLSNGRYNVELNFAELYFTQAGQRVFSVNIEGGKTELVDLDVVAQAGEANRALSRSFAINVTDGNLSLVFTSKVSKAMISAIQITPASSARVGAEALAGTQIEETTLQVSPNPFRDKVTLTFPADQSGKVAVSLRNVQGKVVYQNEQELQASKQLEVHLADGSIASGLYLLEVHTSDGKRQIVKLIKH